MNASTDTRTRSDWLRLALSLSIVLNLFLISLIGGHFLRHRGGSPEFAADAAPMAGALARAEAVLDPADAAAFRAVLARDKPRYAQSAEQVGAARRSLARRIAAEPFDPRTASEALGAWRTSWDRFMSDFSGPLIDALASISPEGRRRLIELRREQREMRGQRFEDKRETAPPH
jgi:uncharacterized membrane protein